MATAPLRFEAEIRKAMLAEIASDRHPGTLDDVNALVDALVGLVMREYYESVDPDHRMESCEECGRYAEDIIMPTKIDDKDVCYDCFIDLGGNPDEGE